MNYIPYKHFLPRAPTEPESIRVNHGFGCEGSSKSLLIERKSNGTVSAYCFRCTRSGFYNKHANGFKRLKKNKRISTRNNILTFPKSIVTDPKLFSKEAYEWIGKFGITDKEIIDNNILYNYYTKRILLPIYYKNKLIGYQSRKIYEEDTYPKYLTYGFKEKKIGKYINNNTDKIVIVEDMLSAIKCSRYISSYAILGSNISDYIKYMLLNNHKEFIIFLDNDNKIIKKIQNNLFTFFSMFGITTLIKEDKDPKELSDIKLKSLLL